MNKVIDVIFRDIKKDKCIYVSLLIVLFVSILFGAFFIKILESNDLKLLTNHINSYFDSIKSNKIEFNLYNNIINTSITLFILKLAI